MTRITKDLSKLSEEELINAISRSALAYLAIKDRSEVKMKEYLSGKYEGYDKQIKEIIEKLKERDLINDLRLAKERCSQYLSANESNVAIRKKLEKEGLDFKNVAHMLASEENRVKEKAGNYAGSNNKLPEKQIRQKIYSRLRRDGFSHEMCKIALDSLKLDIDKDAQIQLLKREAEKAARRYQRKYSGYELRAHLLKYLMSKGYEYAMIDEVIKESEL